MNYRRLADAVRIFHWVWVGSLCTGLFITSFYPRTYPALIAVLLVTFISQILWGCCPLTLLEDALRMRAGEKVLPHDSFIVRAIRHRFGVDVPPWVITAQLVLLTAVTLYLFWTGHFDHLGTK